MKISVIIPAHNEAPNIEAALRAILAQDHPDFRVIVIDNASTDETSRIASAFPVKVLQESRKGTMWACECGRQEAMSVAVKPDIIVRMDADCLPDTDWLSRGAKYFENQSVSAVSGPYDYYDGGWFFRKTSLATQALLYPLINRVFQFLWIGALSIGGNTFLRANTLADAGGFDTGRVFYGDDTETARRAAEYGRVVFSRKVVMKTSARRFRKEGAFKLTVIYWYHFFKAISHALLSTHFRSDSRD